MVEEIRYEPQSKKFTFKLELDGKKTESVRPQRFSPVDKWGKYRRKALAKKEE